MAIAVLLMATGMSYAQFAVGVGGAATRIGIAGLATLSILSPCASSLQQVLPYIGCMVGRAQQTTAAPEDVLRQNETRSMIQGPRLGDHLLGPIAGSSLPLIRTMTSLNVGAGISNGLSLPLFTIAGQPVYTSVGEIAIVGFYARHEQAIKPRLSVYAEAQMVGRLGTNITSLLGQGVNTVTSFDLG